MPPKTAKPKTGKPAAAQFKKGPPAKQETGAATTAVGVEQKLVALSEQMGRLIGTVQTKAEGWLDPKYVRDQITRIQEGATDLLSHLGNAAGKPTEPEPQPARPRSRSGGKVDAPGKKHRPPPPSMRPAKLSDDRVATL